jgi:hypothetical protein
MNDTGLALEFVGTANPFGLGAEDCLWCGRVFRPQSAVVLGLLCGEVVGFVCRECLPPKARTVFDEKCRLYATGDGR